MYDSYSLFTRSSTHSDQVTFWNLVCYNIVVNVFAIESYVSFQIYIIFNSYPIDSGWVPRSWRSCPYILWVEMD